MNKFQENYGTIFKSLTPEQERVIDKLKVYIASVINNSPNEVLPLEVLIDQSSIAATREHMIGVLALVGDHYLAVILDEEDGELLSLSESGQSWIDGKQAQGPGVEAQSSDTDTEINDHT
jgi:hypothetical protein